MKPIKLICKCGAVYNVPAKFAGKKVKCKMCPMRLEVPGASSGNPAGARQRRSTAHKTPEQIKREKEDALLKNYEGSIKRKEDFENFIEDNFKSAFEESRLDFAIGGIIFGIVCLVTAIALLIYMLGVEDGDVVPKVIGVLMIMWGVWWVPPLIFGVGIWRLVVGVHDVMHVRKIRRERAQGDK